VYPSAWDLVLVLTVGIAPLQRYGTVGYSPSSAGSPKAFHRTQTIEFAPSVGRRRGRLGTSSIIEEYRHGVEPIEHSDRSKSIVTP